MDEEQHSNYYRTHFGEPKIVRCTCCGRVHDRYECPECGSVDIQVVKCRSDRDELEEAYDNLYDIIDEDLEEKERT